MAARRRRNRHRRRRGRFSFLYKLLSFLLIFAAILTGCVVFFRVNQVEVTGNSRYSAQEIIEASGVEMGDNLFLTNKPQTVLSIKRKLPYVEKVAVVKSLPDTLELRITESAAVAVLEAEGQHWLINSEVKLVEVGDESLGQGLPKVIGLTPVTPTLGMSVAVAAEEQGRADGLRGLLTALSERDMAESVAEFIDLTGAGSIYFGYGEDLTVVVPMAGDFPRRVFSLQRVLEKFQQQGETVTGTLDLTYGNEQARLLPEQWLPEGWKGGSGDAPG